jgi:hypothetical protein
MRAVLVFCEGNHDVKFVTRSLGVLAGGKWIGGPIKDLPAPLGPKHDPKDATKPIIRGLIAKRYEDRLVEDLGLQAAAHAPVPTFEAVVKIPEDILCVVIRCNGDGAASSATSLVEDMQVLMRVASDLDSIALAFVLDADDGVAEREAKFTAAYSTCLVGRSIRHGQWLDGGPYGPVGLFVFHDETTLAGTLEDALGPMVGRQWPERWEAADLYLRQHAQMGDPLHRKPAEYTKAQIGVTGQFLFPGDPMTEVIGRKGLAEAHFQGPVSRALVEFLRAVPW